jgi:hypothetical protein
MSSVEFRIDIAAPVQHADHEDVLPLHLVENHIVFEHYASKRTSQQGTIFANEREIAKTLKPRIKTARKVTRRVPVPFREIGENAK